LSRGIINIDADATIDGSFSPSLSDKESTAQYRSIYSFTDTRTGQVGKWMSIISFFKKNSTQSVLANQYGGQADLHSILCWFLNYGFDRGE